MIGWQSPFPSLPTTRTEHQSHRLRFSVEAWRCVSLFQFCYWYPFYLRDCSLSFKSPSFSLALLIIHSIFAYYCRPVALVHQELNHGHVTKTITSVVIVLEFLNAIHNKHYSFLVHAGRPLTIYFATPSSTFLLIPFAAIDFPKKKIFHQIFAKTPALSKTSFLHITQSNLAGRANTTPELSPRWGRFRPRWQPSVS